MAWSNPIFYIVFLGQILLISYYFLKKLLRNVNESPKRRADLHRRKLKDVVSPLLIVATIALMAASVLVDFYIHDFNVTWSHNTALRTIVMLITNALLFAVGAWQLYGKKLDPYQSSADRVRRAAIGIRSLLYVSMALSVFLMTTSADDFYALDALDAIIMSLYFQAIVMLSVGSVLHGLKPDDIDFDVYKVT